MLAQKLANMALLKSFCCCSLVQASIVTGVYVAVVYFAAFVMELCLVMEGENWVNSGREKGPLPLPSYILVVLHFTVVGLSIIMLYALYQKRVGVLLAWVIVMGLLFLPELCFVVYTVLYHWEITSAFGLAEVIFYLVRAPVNVMCVLCVHSLHGTWKTEFETEKTFKKLSDIQMMREINNKPLAYRNAAYRNSIDSLSVRSSPAGSLRGPPSRAYAPQGIYPQKYGTVVNGTVKSNGSFKMNGPALSRRFSTASQYSCYNKGYASSVIEAPVTQNYNAGVSPWNVYSNPYKESQSEFNASLYPAFSPFGSTPMLHHSRSEQNILQATQTVPVVSPYFGSNMTTYPLSSMSRGLLDPEYVINYSRPVVHPDYTTQSLDRRRYLRRSQSLSMEPYSLPRTQLVNPYHGYPRHQESKSSLGAESDDFRRYRDVAL